MDYFGTFLANFLGFIFHAVRWIMASRRRVGAPIRSPGPQLALFPIDL